MARATKSKQKKPARRVALEKRYRKVTKRKGVRLGAYSDVELRTEIKRRVRGASKGKRKPRSRTWDGHNPDADNHDVNRDARVYAPRLYNADAWWSRRNKNTPRPPTDEAMPAVQPEDAMPAPAEDETAGTLDAQMHLSPQMLQQIASNPQLKAMLPAEAKIALKQYGL